MLLDLRAASVILPGEVKLPTAQEAELLKQLLGAETTATHAFVAQIVPGSFIDAKDDETLYLIRHSQAGENSGTIGRQLDSRIVVTRQGKVVCNHPFAGGFVSFVGDVDLDGVAEFLLTDGGVYMGEEWQNAQVASLLGGRLTVLHNFGKVQNLVGCWEGSAHPQPFHLTSVLWMSPPVRGRQPQFWVTRFRGPCPRREDQILTPRDYVAIGDAAVDATDGDLRPTEPPSTSPERRDTDP